MSDTISIKPHHFVDILTDLGRGTLDLTPHPYGHALHRVAARMTADPDAPLVLALGADDICQPCQHNVDGRCDDTIDTGHRPQAPTTKQAYNLLLDTRWLSWLKRRDGDRLTVEQFCTLLLVSESGLEAIYREEPPDYAPAKLEGIRRGAAALLASLRPRPRFDLPRDVG